jgi:hypothetical protein
MVMISRSVHRYLPTKIRLCTVEFDTEVLKLRAKHAPIMASLCSLIYPFCFHLWYETDCFTSGKNVDELPCTETEPHAHT